jgi:hypothetical protein
MPAAAKPYRTKFTNYDARRDPKTDHFCCVCQKDLKPGAPFRMVHLVDGGGFVLHPEDEALYSRTGERRGDVGGHPIGPDCARKLGLEWTSEASQ